MPRGDRDKWGGPRPKTRPDDDRGRPVVKATIQNGDGLMMTLVTPEGTADLGHGIAEIDKLGRSRIIKVKLVNGDEIRILVVK